MENVTELQCSSPSFLSTLEWGHLVQQILIWYTLKDSSTNREVSSEKVEGFFRRRLGSYAHKFLKQYATSLMDLPELRLCLPELHL